MALNLLSKPIAIMIRWLVDRLSQSSMVAVATTELSVVQQRSTAPKMSQYVLTGRLMAVASSGATALRVSLSFWYESVDGRCCNMHRIGPSQRMKRVRIDYWKFETWYSKCFAVMAKTYFFNLIISSFFLFGITFQLKYSLLSTRQFLYGSLRETFRVSCRNLFRKLLLEVFL